MEKSHPTVVKISHPFKIFCCLLRSGQANIPPEGMGNWAPSIFSIYKSPLDFKLNSVQILKQHCPQHLEPKGSPPIEQQWEGCRHCNFLPSFYCWRAKGHPASCAAPSSNLPLFTFTYPLAKVNTLLWLIASLCSSHVTISNQRVTIELPVTSPSKGEGKSETVPCREVHDWKAQSDSLSCPSWPVVWNHWFSICPW